MPEVMVQMASDSDIKEKRLGDRLDGVVKKSVREVVAESLHGRMRSLVSKMQNQWAFEEKWEYKIVQLEQGSKDGTISWAECPNQEECPRRLGETVVYQSGEGGQDCHERVRDTEFHRRSFESGDCQLERKTESAASTVATSSGGGASTVNHAAPGAPEAFVPSRVKTERAESMEEHPRDGNHRRRSQDSNSSGNDYG